MLAEPDTKLPEHMYKLQKSKDSGMLAGLSPDLLLCYLMTCWNYLCPQLLGRSPGPEIILAPSQNAHDDRELSYDQDKWLLTWDPRNPQELSQRVHRTTEVIHEVLCSGAVF